MRNLLTLNELSIEQVEKIISLASKFKSGFFVSYKEKKIATLFFEDSTRTHYSFITAMHNLQITPIDVNVRTSSINKGESLYDTVKVFESFGLDGVIIRHTENEYYKSLENINLSIINGGDGSSNHPTQSLLDLMTIYEEFNTFKNLKVCIIGDIKHSRVAHGNIKIMERLGMDVYICGPSEFLDNSCKVIELDKAIEMCEVIMPLRVQFERHKENSMFLEKEYNKNFGINKDRVSKMKDNAIIMHPAPFNRGIEIDSDCVECPKSRIFKQMQNGVYVRMSVISLCLDGNL